MDRVIMIEMHLPDGLPEQVIRTFLEEALDHALTSPMGAGLWSPEVSPAVKIVEIT